LISIVVKKFSFTPGAKKMSHYGSFFFNLKPVYTLVVIIIAALHNDGVIRAILARFYQNGTCARAAFL
jgi:hypothetical protein